ncbi:MAG: GatB/YqeY domain-containing protein [Candidatus Omnitrophica bacterium]|nr:GatB/YqeY domain-containing protein [Candidatus Omnitrophota bacterium]
MTEKSLSSKIENEIKTALKAGDKIKVSTLRMLKADIVNEAIARKKSDLNESEIMAVIGRQIKRHLDSIEQFQKGKRLDLAEKEKQELEVLKSYMPEQLKDDEIEKIIRLAISETNASGAKDMGRVMKAVTEKTKMRADGKKVSDMVKKLLG